MKIITKILKEVPISVDFTFDRIIIDGEKMKAQINVAFYPHSNVNEDMVHDVFYIHLPCKLEDINDKAQTIVNNHLQKLNDNGCRFVINDDILRSVRNGLNDYFMIK